MQREPFLRWDERHWLIPNDIFSGGVTAGITSRCGGNSTSFYDSLNTAFYVGDDKNAVLENRKRVAEAVDFPLSDWVTAKQVHKAEIAEISSKDRGRGAHDIESSAGEYDGLYTHSKGVLLAGFYADCVPLLFYAPEYECVGIAHAGWKGTSLNIAGTFVQKWEKKENIAPEQICVVIGPAISASVYEVDNAVIHWMKEVLPTGSRKPWEAAAPGKWLLDMKEMNRVLLKNAGVLDSNIFVSSHCTYSEPENFYSHRRDGEPSGRMMAFIGMKRE